MKNTTILSILLICSFLGSDLKAQTQEIDSLENLLVLHTQKDTVRVNLLNEIAYKIYLKDINKTLEYATESGELASELKFKKGEAESLKIKAVYYVMNFDYKEGLKYFTKSLAIFESLGNNKQIVNSLNNLGRVNQFLSNYSAALENYQKALILTKTIGFDEKRANIYNNIGNTYFLQSNYPKTLEYFQKGLEINEKLNNKNEISSSYIGIGFFYDSQGEYSKALKYFRKSLEINKELKDKKTISYCYNNIGKTYQSKNQFDSALIYFDKSLILKEQLKDKYGISYTCVGVGAVYNSIGEYDKAIVFLNKAITISREIGEKSIETNAYSELALLYSKHSDIQKTYNNSKKAFLLAEEIGNIEIQQKSSEILANTCNLLGLYKEAYRYHVVFKTMTDSLFNVKNVKKIASIEYEYKHEKEKQNNILQQQKKDAVRAEEEKRQKAIRNSFIGGFALMLILLVVAFASFLQKRKANKIITETNEELNITLEVVNKQKEEITAQHTEIVVHLDKLARQNKHITGSINYAKRIQTAVLPAANVLEKILPEHFVLFKPRDIVSGDFYWIKKINENIIIAVADSTGHGVPGAFMSMLGISFLNEIAQKKEIQQANQVLDELRNRVKTTLDQTGKDNEAEDGMDIALYAINTETNELQFSGANNPLLIFRNNELIELKADKQPISIFHKERPFTNHKFQLEKNDMLYAFSDGYADQFGGKKGRKFYSKRFYQLLSDIQDKKMQEQKQILEKTFTNWLGKGKQIDDVLVMGVKL